MKNIMYFAILILLSVFSINCGDSSTTGVSNKYLGNLPGIIQAYEEKVSELEADGKKATSMDDAFEVQQKIKLAKEEVEKYIQEELKNIKFPITVPIEGQIKTSSYEIKELKITGAQYNTVLLSAKVIPLISNEFIAGYLHLTDGNGKALATEKDWGVVIVSNFHQVKQGQEIEMKGSYRGLEKLENFEKVVFGSKEEYEKSR